MKKLVLMVVSALCLLTLVACSNVSETIRETSTEVRKDVSDTVGKELDHLAIQEVISLTSVTDKVGLDKDFSGYVFIMADKQMLDKLSKHDFYLEGRLFETVTEDGEDDFNIRHDGKTYFATKVLPVKSLSEIQLSSEWDKELLVVLRVVE